MKRSLIPITCLSATVALLPLAHAQDDVDPFGGSTTRPVDPNAPDPFGGGPARKAKPAKAAEADPFAGDTPGPARKFEEPAQELRADFGMKYEAFSLNLATAAKLARADHSDVDLYETVVAMIENGEAVQELLSVIRTKSGKRSKTDSVFEYIYPTEWDPAEIPNSIGVKMDPPVGPNGQPTGRDPNWAALANAQKLEDLPIFVTPATPTAFETRNLGFTFEVDAIRNADGGLIEAMIAPEHVTLANLSTWGKGVSMLEMPEIETQRLSTSVTLVPGLPRFIGTINRPPVSKINPKSKDRVWFAFLTATNVK